MDAAEVLRNALALEPEARAALVDSLIGSLDQQIDPGVEERWREEIFRRLQEIDRGAVALVPWEDARRRLRSRLQGERHGRLEPGARKGTTVAHRLIIRSIGEIV